MNMKPIIHAMLILCWLGGAATLQAQSTGDGGYTKERLSPQRVDRSAWASAKKGISYPSSSSQAEPEGHEGEGQSSSNTEAGGGERPDEYNPPREPLIRFDSFWAELFFKAILFLGVAVAIAFLIRYLLGIQQQPKDQKLRKTGGMGVIDLERIEEDLHEANLEDFIGQAERAGNYRLAMRLHYLALLKELSLAGAIVWKKDKTNRQYLQELTQTDWKASFRQLTRIFEHYWYGDHELPEADYAQIAPQFRQFSNQIKPHALADAK
jgi:hypothetical protein